LILYKVQKNNCLCISLATIFYFAVMPCEKSSKQFEERALYKEMGCNTFINAIVYYIVSWNDHAGFFVTISSSKLHCRFFKVWKLFKISAFVAQHMRKCFKVFIKKKQKQSYSLLSLSVWSLPSCNMKTNKKIPY